MIDPQSKGPITLKGSCHCGAVKFTATLTSTPESFRITEGADKLATYRFNTGVAEHHFCPVCGIYTHHRRRSNPNELGVNVACLEGVSPFDFRKVKVHDGTRHPSDDPEHRSYSAGVLRFEPVSEDWAASLSRRRPSRGNSSRSASSISLARISDLFS